MIIKIGRIGRINIKATQKAARVLLNHDHFYCELKFPGCFLHPTIAHRHKRDWYKSHPDFPEILWDYKQIIASCLPCHIKIEKDRELTEEVFFRLRGEE